MLQKYYDTIIAMWLPSALVCRKTARKVRVC